MRVPLNCAIAIIHVQQRETNTMQTFTTTIGENKLNAQTVQDWS